MSLQQTQRVGVEMIVRDLRNRNTRLIRKIDERHAHLTTLSTHTHTRDVCLGLCLGLHSTSRQVSSRRSRVLLEVEDADFRWRDEEEPFAGSNMDDDDDDDDALMLLFDDDFDGGTKGRA